MSNDILIIAVIESLLTMDSKKNIADSIKEGFDKGVLVKDKSMSNIYVIDKEKKELITIVY